MAGELTAPASGSFDPMAHLTRHNIMVHSPKPPQWLTIRLKQSKTDQFREGNLMTVGRTRRKLCPVEAVLAFIMIQGRQEGPLFKYKDGRSLTRARLDAYLKKALGQAGVDTTGISTQASELKQPQQQHRGVWKTRLLRTYRGGRAGPT